MLICPEHKINIPVRKILVIQLGDIGDVVWAIPSFWALKEAFPAAALFVMVRNNYGEFLYDDPHVDGIFEVRNDEGAFGGLRLLRKIRAEKFDLLFDLRADDRGAFVSLLSGAKMRAALYYGSIPWRNRAFTHLVQPVPKKENVLGASEQSLKIIRGFGIRETTRTPQIFVDERLKERVLKLLSAEKVETQKGWISINPFSRWSYKEWGDDKWKQLASFVRETYKIPLVITGSAAERGRAGEFAGGNVSIVNLAGKTTLREMACLLQMSLLHIGVDSAAPHIAAAVGTPTVTIYGPSDWRDWAPTGERNQVVVPDMDCVPCSNKGCEGSEKSKCLEALPINKVREAVKRMMEKFVTQKDS